jgi:hypothetical protein
MKSIDDKSVIVVEEPFECDGNKTPFGRRWSGEVVEIGEEELEALKSGKLLAIDVNAEYVVFVKKSDGEQ